MLAKAARERVSIGLLTRDQVGSREQKRKLKGKKERLELYCGVSFPPFRSINSFISSISSQYFPYFPSLPASLLSSARVGGNQTHKFALKSVLQSLPQRWKKRRGLLIPALFSSNSNSN